VHRRIWRVARRPVDDALIDLSAQESAQLMRLLTRMKKTLVADTGAVNGNGASRPARAHRHNGSTSP
jgi:hypothetical protein